MVTVDPKQNAVFSPAKKRPASVHGDVILTSHQIDSFNREGFLSIPSVSTPAEIRWLTHLYDQMFAERVGYDDGYLVDFAGDEATGEMKIPQLLGPVAYRPKLRETAIWRNCEAMARQLLGPEATFRFDHALTKPANGGVPTPWHQDQAFYPRGTKYQTISFWIPLQDVAPESGCLKYVGESHKGPLHLHRPIGGNTGIHGLEALGVEEGTRVRYCPLPAGGAVVHHRLTLHGADSNVTTTPRRAYGIAFGLRRPFIVIPKEYPWNGIKHTAGDVRRKSAPSHRVKLYFKRSLMRWGLLDR
ncbi:MAG: Phytanoyl-CoA dioxygenase [Rhodospirillales bacterium]|nr:Phytanoyl-CoA dioxygenase [Rhodospirillales bacterium]